MGDAPQSLLLPVPCPACGRPAHEFSPCPWCGERAPASPRTRGGLARLAAGFALLAAGAAGAAGGTFSAAAAAAGLFAGFLLAVPSPSGKGGGGPERRLASLGAANGPALLSAFLALALRAGDVPFPIAAARFAWLFPALAAAAFALRVPAEEPDAPASGASARGRALRRSAPDLLASLSLLPFAAVFAVFGASPPSLAGLSSVLGVWFSRLGRPAAPLLLSSAAFALLLPDPAFFAFGLLAAGLSRSTGIRVRTLAARRDGVVG